MFLKVKALAHLWDDATKLLPLFTASEEDLLAVEVDGYQEYQAGKLKILQTDPAATISFGTVAAAKLLLLRVEGADGVDLTINGGTAREIRPITAAATASESTPVSFYLETSDDLSTIQLAHPGSVGADPVYVFFLLVGDAE